MAIHQEVLAAARRLCQARGSWTFSPAEIVDALPHLNERSVRTHVVSRCCANAPSHHPHRWPYFHRVKRGVYEIRAGYRDAEPLKVADAAATYELGTVSPRQSIHAVVVESEGLYVAECLEIAIVTQGTTLDETLAHLRDAIDLYMADEDPAAVGVIRHPRLLVTLDVATGREQLSSAIANAPGLLSTTVPRIRRLGARDVLRVLHEFGFEVVSMRGRHAKLARIVGGRKEILVVPVKRQLTVGTVHAIYRQACRFIPEDRLRPRFFAD